MVVLELICSKVLDTGPNVTEASLLDIKMSLLDSLAKWLPPYVLRNERLVEIFRRLLDPDPTRRFPNAQTAESSSEGLALVARQLTQLDMDSDYRRDLAAYVKMAGIARN